MWQQKAEEWGKCECSTATLHEELLFFFSFFFFSYQCVTAGWGTAGRGGPGAAAWGFPGSRHQSSALEDGRGESCRGERQTNGSERRNGIRLTALESGEKVEDGGSSARF